MTPSTSAAVAIGQWNDRARHHERYALDSKASLYGCAGGLSGYALNISTGGVRLLFETDAPAAAERVLSALDLTVVLEGACARSARVAWYRLVPGGIVVGLAFGDAGLL
jgi:hypothetical protein